MPVSLVGYKESTPSLAVMLPCCSLYAMLHVHLLQHQGASEKLLTLLLAMKKQ